MKIIIVDIIFLSLCKSAFGIIRDSFHSISFIICILGAIPTSHFVIPAIGAETNPSLFRFAHSQHIFDDFFHEAQSVLDRSAILVRAAVGHAL